MANIWHDVDRKKKDEFNVIVECPKGSRVKYEVDKETGLIAFDRVLYSPMHYNNNYGFVPQTLWDDGDPLDVLVMTHEALVPGCLVKCRPLGVLGMIDGGDSDVKVLAVPVKDPRFETIKNIKDVDPHFLKEVHHFFQVYKDLQKKKVKVGKWNNKAAAIKAVERSFELYDKKYRFDGKTQPKKTATKKKASKKVVVSVSKNKKVSVKKKAVKRSAKKK